MKPSGVFLRLASILVIPCLVSVTVLYLYPVFFPGCDFPTPHKRQVECFLEPQTQQNLVKETNVAPFRLLVLADPQLEGDSSLPSEDEVSFPSLRGLSAASNPVTALGPALKDLILHDLPTIAWSLRKRLDLLGNDYYLAHIYRVLHWWSQPTHVTVLGDLIGSQWVSDEEFERRGWRYWNRVFRTAQRVEDHITAGGVQEILGQDPAWKTRLINIVGNHDVGYAGDLDRERIDRFTRVYGAPNWDIKFTLPRNNSSPKDLFLGGPPQLHLVVLNSMNLDGPVLDDELQKETYEFMGSAIGGAAPVENTRSATVVLTHIPLHKEAGVCVDAPFFDWRETGIKEQNHLSEHASKAILEGIFGLNGNPAAPRNGLGRRGIILNGHDHEGCQTYHYIPSDRPENSTSDWKAGRWKQAQDVVNSDPPIPGMREITVRSMMGEFGGNAGLLSAWFDDEADIWHFAYASCELGVQHIWWAINGLAVVTISLFAAALVSLLAETTVGRGRTLESSVDVKGIGSHDKTARLATANSNTETAIASGRQATNAGLHRRDQRTKM